MNLNSREIRVGNVVMDHGLSPKIATVIPSTIQYIWSGSNTYYGLPLTRVILERSGFSFEEAEKDFGSPAHFCHIRDDGKIINLRFKVYEEPIQNKYEFYMCDDSSWETPYKPIQYVHQLQNLYFALYGEELNIVL